MSVVCWLQTGPAVALRPPEWRLASPDG